MLPEKLKKRNCLSKKYPVTEKKKNPENQATEDCVG